MKAATVIIAVGLVAWATQATAECDFDKPVGSCTGNVTITGTGGAAPSYSAELSISSSAGSCSKIEYFIDSTPYTSIIRSGGGSEAESVFGSKPVASGDIQVSKCVAYEGGAGGREELQKGDVAVGESIDGTWRFGTGTLTLKEKKGKVTGTGQYTSVFQMEGYPDVVSLFKVKFKGTRQADKLKWSYVSQIAGHSPNTFSGVWTIDGDTMKDETGRVMADR